MASRYLALALALASVLCGCRTASIPSASTFPAPSGEVLEAPAGIQGVITIGRPPLYGFSIGVLAGDTVVVRFTRYSDGPLPHSLWLLGSDDLLTWYYLGCIYWKDENAHWWIGALPIPEGKSVQFFNVTEKPPAPVSG